METIIAVIVTAFLAPVILTLLNNRARRADRLEDAAIRKAERAEQWEREDRVAARAVDAAKAVADKVEETATQAVVDRQLLSDKIDVIHTLTDGNVTRQVLATLDEAERGLVALKEIAALRAEKGLEPSVEAKAVMAATQSRIETLRNEMAKRNEIDALAHEEAVTDKAQAKATEAEAEANQAASEAK